MTDTALLNERTAGKYLADRGVISDPAAHTTALTGGVSNVVLLIESSPARVVLKQALPKLAVAEEWLADPARAQAEAAALSLLHEMTPGAVPELIDSDPIRYTLTISAAPPDWHDWKSELIVGTVRPWVADRLGALLSKWHRSTDGSRLPRILEGLTSFEQLRVAPYFGAAGSRIPALRPQLEALADDIRSRERCLVLGDFSPKNVLVGEDALWVIDLEVAHRGDPSFDVAFLLAHLAGKASFLPDRAYLFDAAARRFLLAYGEGPALEDQRHLGSVLAGLLIARVYGNSPLEYLTPSQGSQLADKAARVLTSPSETVLQSWEEIIAL